MVEALGRASSRSGRGTGRWSSPRTAWPSGGSSRAPGSRSRRGARSGPWPEATAAARDLGLPLRLKLPIGGYDGRGQLRIATTGELEDAWERLGRPAGTPLLAERELDFEAELSVVVARGLDGAVAAFPVARNAHDAGILVESVAPAPVLPASPPARSGSGTTLAEAMDLCGTLTAELFLLRDGSLVVNELAPRVHNSGHWTIEGAATSQFEQHIRAICGLGLGETAALAPTAMVNLLGSGPLRDACLQGVASALADPSVHLHLYDKRRVFERRKMGHLTATGPDVDTALAAARRALDRLSLGGRRDRGGGSMTEARSARRAGGRHRRRQPLGLPDARGGGGGAR